MDDLGVPLFSETSIYIIYYWLVVSTHLKNISQIGSFPQVGVKIKNIWNHQPDYISQIPPCVWRTSRFRPRGFTGGSGWSSDGTHPRFMCIYHEKINSNWKPTIGLKCSLQAAALHECFLCYQNHTLSSKSYRRLITTIVIIESANLGSIHVGIGIIPGYKRWIPRVLPWVHEFI